MACGIEFPIFLAGLIMGTGSTLTIKVVYELTAEGIDGVEKKFEKPLFTTWIMFLAMCLALPLHHFWQWLSPRLKRRKAQKQNGLGEPLLDGEETVTTSVSVPWRTYFMLIVPAMFDLVGTAFAKVGLMYCTVSVYQLVRCTVMIVTALLKVFVLKHPLTNYMWAGVTINTLAMVLVSASSFVGGTDDGGRDPRIGILFLLMSCLVQGSQYVFEEKMMQVDGAPPLVVVGMEGFWGALIMGLVVWPWAYIIPGDDAGSLENVQDSWAMLKNSPEILWVLVGFLITVFLYNVLACFVTYLLSSLWHAILDNFRPVTVWAVDLFLWYAVFHQSGNIGEPWTRYSWLQFIGMLVLFFGTAVYNKTIKLPCLAYEEEESAAIAAADSGAGGDGDPSLVGQLFNNTPSTRMAVRKGTAAEDDYHMKSPSLTRSPYFVASVKAHTSDGRGLSGMETSPYLRVRTQPGALLSPNLRRRTQSDAEMGGMMQLSPTRGPR